MDDLVGRQLGAYQIVKRLGEGGIGAVFLARHSRTGKSYAVKVLLSDKTSEAAQDRFQREALALSKLRHPNIVQIHDYNVDETGMAYLVMDHLQGEDLAERLERQGPLSWNKAYEIFIDVQKALSAAHGSGILHRDLKPANIFLSNEDGEQERALVLDFGLAKIMSDADTTKLTQTGATMGTPLYMSPEQARAEALDARTDVYSLGCILFEMLSGSPPFSGSTLSALLLKVMTDPPPLLSVRAPQVSPELDEVLRVSMAKVPGERYSSVQELRNAVERATAGWRGSTPTQTAHRVKLGTERTMAAPGAHSAESNPSSRAPRVNPEHGFTAAGVSAPEQGGHSQPPAARPKRVSYLLTVLLALLVGLVGVGVWFAYSALQTARQAASDNAGLAQELALKSALNSRLEPKTPTKTGAPPTVQEIEALPNPVKEARAEGLVHDKKVKRKAQRAKKRKVANDLTEPKTVQPLPPPTGAKAGETDAEYSARMQAYAQAQYQKSINMMNTMIRNAENTRAALKKVRGQLDGRVTNKPKLCGSAAGAQLKAAKSKVGKDYAPYITNMVEQRQELCDTYSSWEHPEGTALGLVRKTPSVVAEAEALLQRAKPEEQAAMGPLIKSFGRSMTQPGRFPCFKSLSTLKAKIAELGHSRAGSMLMSHHQRTCRELGATLIKGRRDTIKSIIQSYSESLGKTIATYQSSLASMQQAREQTRRR